MTAPFKHNSRSLSIKFPTIFRRLIFTFDFRVRLFFEEKIKPKIVGFENAMEDESEKCLTFVIR